MEVLCFRQEINPYDYGAEGGFVDGEVPEGGRRERESGPGPIPSTRTSYNPYPFNRVSSSTVRHRLLDSSKRGDFQCDIQLDVDT